MGEVIAVPVVSQPRAAEVLATLRRLEEEYRLAPSRSGPQPAGRAARRRERPGGAFRPWRAGAAGAAGAAIGGIAGAGAVFLGAAVVGGPSRSIGALRSSLAGGLLGAAVGALARRSSGPGGRRRGQDDRPVTWLVSYVTWDEATPRPRGVRLSVLRVTLPEAAGARLKAILARASARPAPATPPDREAASGTGSAGPETPPA
jgi:hypothetical protein